MVSQSTRVMVAAGILLLVAWLLRRLLGLGASDRPALLSLAGERGRAFHAVAHKIETGAAVLAISLDEAIGEHAAGHAENARSLLRLASTQWDRVAETLNNVLAKIIRNPPYTASATRSRLVSAKYFRSDAMINYLRMSETMHQYFFRDRSRFNFQMRLLRRAVDTLTVDFHGALERVSFDYEDSSLIFGQIDRDFHDLDLLAQETLLAFRCLVACLPEHRLEF